jgi:hypothetical protein
MAEMNSLESLACESASKEFGESMTDMLGNVYLDAVKRCMDAVSQKGITLDRAHAMYIGHLVGKYAAQLTVGDIAPLIESALNLDYVPNMVVGAMVTEPRTTTNAGGGG